MRSVQGNIASWKKKEGDEIAAGDVICEVETDKARYPAGIIAFHCLLCKDPGRSEAKELRSILRRAASAKRMGVNNAYVL
jgi:hypothetical protein